MPRIGNVDVSDSVVQSLVRASAPAAPARPGLGAVLGGAAETALGQLRYGLPYQAERLAGTITPERELGYRQGLAETASAVAPASVSDLTSGRVGFGRFVGENVAASLPYMAGSVLGGALGYARGGAAGAVVGAIAGGTPQFSASNVSRAVEENGSLTNAAAARALAVAPFQSAADAAIARFLPGAGKVLGDMAAHQTGGFLRRTAMSMVEAAGTEAVTEAAQQVGERYAAGLKLNDADAAGEYVNAAVTAFAVGGVLGAGGGFRRSNAVAKPADMVTPEDMTAHIDSVLDGSARVTAPLALPAPADITVDTSGTARVNPNGSVVQALPSPEQFAGPDYVVDSDGRVVQPGLEGERAIAVDRNLPATPGPTDAELLAGITQQPAAAPNVLAQPPATPPAAPSTSVAALTGTPVGQAPQVDIPASASRRIFASEPIADLNTALRTKNATPEIRATAEQEIAARWAEAAGTEPLTAENYQTRLDDVKHGLRGGWVQSLEAANPTDLVDKVYTRIFDDADTSANVQKLAQRIGLLDDQLNPTPLAAQIDASRTADLEAQAQPIGGLGEAGPVSPLAPVSPEVASASALPTERPAAATVPAAPLISPPAQFDPAFAAEWDGLKKSAGIARMRSGQDVLGQTPANLQQAQAQVFRALATDSSDAEVSQVEKMAKTMGLVTNDDAMDVTPLGRQAFLTTPEGLEETVSAARQQGYTGAQASIFDRGVRAQIAGEAAPALASFDDMAAFQAGQVWAQDFIQNAQTRTAAQTDAIRARQGGRTTGTAVDRQSDAARRELSPQQVQQQSLNRLLDAANLRAVSDSDVAELRRMVRSGSSPFEVGKALERVQGGQTLFSQPDSAPVMLSRPEGRGQPVFKELYDPAEQTPAKTEQRVETEAAVQSYELRSLIEFAKAEKGITEQRAAKLHEMLDQGKAAQVKRLLRDFDPDAKPRQATARLPKPPETVFDRGKTGLSSGDPDAQFEAAMDGKDFMGAIDHMIAQAPSLYHREIMKRVKALADKLTKAGVTLDLKIIRPGDVAPVVLNNPTIRAFTVSELNPARSTVYLKGTEMGETSGMNYQLAAHEMLHAVTDRLVDFGSRPGLSEGTALRKDVRDLLDLGNAIISHFNQRAAAGTLGEFEKAYFNRANNALANAHEIIAWGLTNPDMQRYLQTIEYKPRQSVFGRMVELLRKLLGLDGKYDTALTELLRVSERIMKPGQQDIISAYARNNTTGLDTATIEAPAMEAQAARTATDMNGVTEQISRAAAGIADRINPRDLGAKARRTALGWLSHNQIDRQYGQQIPSVVEHSDAHRERVALRSRFEQMGEAAYQTFEQLEQANAKAAERVGQLMATTTEFQIDPEKAWSEHTWLHDDPNAARLQQLHREAVNLANALKRGDSAGWQSFQNFRALNEAQNYARMAVGLHGLVATDPELAMGIQNSWVNPADQFMRAEGINSPQQTRDYWARMLDNQVAAATAFVREKKGEATRGTASDQRAMRQHLSPVEMQISAIHEAKAAMGKAPYFHLGRFGDNFGSAVIRRSEDGNVDPVAQRKVADALEKAGFGDAQISADSTKPRFMLRFDTVDQAIKFRQLALDLQRQGLLDAEGEIKVGPRNRADNFGTAEGLPAFVASYIQNLEVSPMFAQDEGMSPADVAALEKMKQDTIQLARDTWIESQPDSSISKVLAKRYTVPGYNKDMIRNFAHRWRVGSINIANVASAPKFNRAFTNMKAQYNDALVANQRDADGNLTAPSDPFTVQDVMSELKLRDAKNPVDETADTFDKMRGYAHSYFLGFSPAYGLVNMTQLGVTALPELAKKHGYGKSFHAMRRASGQAFAIVKAAGAEAAKLGWKHWGDVAITDNVLKNAGLDDKTRDFLQHMLATGTIDIGSMARSLGQVADNKGVGGATETYLRLSSAIGLYTETFSRLVTALAARDLHGGFGEDAQRYATKAVSESMFDYQNWNTARQLGKKGFLGPVTPLLTQFMSYQAQITEKLFSEVSDAFAKPRPGESAAAAATRKAEARRFLLGHMAAVTSLAGTLGLPFATVFATAIERMVDAVDDDDEPFDVTAAYRNFLSSVLGKEVGEVLARGAPRALGFDVSARTGEADLLPFSQLLADRRSWTESLQNYLGRSMGASPNMLVNMADGGAQFASGDVLGGLKTFLPVAFKSPVEVYRMSSEGYVDTKGNKLPMSPTASAYLWQLMGFSPSAKAEYSEARGDQAARRGEITRKAGQLRQGIVRALASGDSDKARELISDAIQFDQDNPAFAVIPSIASTLERNQRTQVQARATNAPVGVTMKDVAGQQLTGYANF